MACLFNIVLFISCQCTPEIDECESLPCANSATCEDRVDGFQCLCAAGYEGILCQIGESTFLCTSNDYQFLSK